MIILGHMHYIHKVEYIFDTDIIMIDSIDDLLENRAFVGYEAPEFPFTAVFGAEKGHPFVKDILDSYENVEKNLILRIIIPFQFQRF